MGITVFREVILCIVLEVYLRSGEPAAACFTLNVEATISLKRGSISNRLLHSSREPHILHYYWLRKLNTIQKFLPFSFKNL
jgi:hypothetical protein